MASFDDRLNSVIGRVENSTNLINIVPGTTIHSILESNVYELAKVESGFNSQVLRNNILTANGSDLDAIAVDIFGLERYGIKPTVITAELKLIKLYSKTTFGGINNGDNIVIGSGDIVIEGTSGTGYWKFTNRDSITLLAANSEQYVDLFLLQGSNAPISSNVIRTHNFKGYADSANYSLYVTNDSPIATGRDIENDDNFRFRISKALQAFVKTNYFGIYDLIIGTPGVSSVDIYNSYNGGGTTRIQINPIAPKASAALINDIKGILEQNIPSWVSYTVSGPSYTGLKLSLTVGFYDPNINTFKEVQSIVSSLQSYINNFGSGSFDILSIPSFITSSNSNISSVLLNSVSKFTGEDDFRKETTIDITNSTETSLYVSSFDRIIVEPIPGAIEIGVA